MRWTAGLLFLMLCTVGAANHVRADDPSLVILGLRSIEGDDEFANAMTDALRTAAKSVGADRAADRAIDPHWRVLDRAVSMSQMVLAYNCDEVDAACLTQISQGLEVDRVIYGTVHRTAAPARYNYEVSVSLFNGVTHTIAATELQTLERSENKKALARAAQLVTARLAKAETNVGRLAVEVNVLSADVRLDDQLVGQTQQSKLALESVPAGQHVLEISAQGHQSRKQTIRIRPGELSEVGITLERAPEPALEQAPLESIASNPNADAHEGSSLSWLGYTLIGVGAASAIAWGASMYIIEFQYNQDETFQRYKNAYQFRRQDACTAALSGDNAGDKLDPSQLSDFQGRCRAGRTFQVLQWVFLGVAVVAAGAGTYVLISDGGGSDRNDDLQARHKRAPRFELEPLVDTRSLALQATLRF